MLKSCCRNWISHSNRQLMMSMLPKKSLDTYLPSCKKINSNITCNRSISNTNVIKQKSDLNDKVQHKDSLFARRNRNASKKERILWYRKQFALFNIHLLLTVGFVIVVCWASPDQRKNMNGRAPTIGQFVDLVLGPSEESSPEINKVENTEESPKKECNAANKD